MNEEEKILKTFALRVKTSLYLMNDDSEKKKAKGIKKRDIKRRLMFQNYKDSLFNNKNILKWQLRFKSNHHDVYTEEVNKITLSSNDNERWETFDWVTTYPHGTNAFKVCENEMLSKFFAMYQKWSILMTMLMKTKLNMTHT